MRKPIQSLAPVSQAAIPALAKKPNSALRMPEKVARSECVCNSKAFSRRYARSKGGALSYIVLGLNNSMGREQMDDLAIIELLVQRLRREFDADLLGMLAGGSRLRGEGDANSDLDVVVVIARPQRRKWCLIMADVLIEMLISPPFQIQRLLEEGRLDGRGLMSHLCSTGRVVFDPQGTMATIQADARSIWERGPPPLSEQERRQYRIRTTDLLRDIEDVRASDEELAVFLITLLVSQLINQHCRITGRWLLRRKRIIVDLAQWDIAASQLARQACGSAASVGARYASVRVLVDHVLAPLGGAIPMDWSTDRKTVEPRGAAPKTPGPPSLTERERWIFRWSAADLLRDIEDVRTNDEQIATYLIGLLLADLIGRHYRIFGRLPHKPKSVMTDLAQWDMVAARLARQACHSTSALGARCAAVRVMADHVLAPLGGVMPKEFSTDWECLKP
jgi:predicted nucleotidyltransferase